LANRAEGRYAPARAVPALLQRSLQKHEDRLFSALGGAMSFQILQTAYRVGLFRLLHALPGLRRGEIAASLGLRPYAAEILLLGLVPLKLVERIEDRYYNDPVLSGLLSGQMDDGGLGKIIEYFSRVINPAMLHFEASVRRNEPVGLQQLFGADAKSFYAAIGRDEERSRCFQAAMQADTRMNRDRVASSGVFAAHRRLLDVGGNTGELAIAVAAYNPTIAITVLDFPEVAARAVERFRAEGLSDRLDAIGVDLLKEPFPPGYDGVVFAHVLDIFSPEKVRRLLEKARDCLPEGGAVTVFGSAMSDDERGPLMYGVLSAYFLCLADGEGRFYTAKQTEDAMRDAGFVDVEKTVLPRGEILLRGFKRRGARPSRLAAFVALVALGRPKFLVYSLLFYGLGSAAVVHEGRALDLARWIHGLAFVSVAHLMTHYCNDYFDLHADSANRAPTRWTGGSRVLVEGRLRPRAALTTALVLLLMALSLSLGMPAVETRWLALPMLALAWFYTAPPLRLNYRGLGEITVAAVLSLAVPLLGHGLQTGHIAAPAALLGALLPLVILQAARMITMNLSDHDSDEATGKRTLAVVLGRRRARQAIAVAQIVAYGWILALTASQILPAAVGLAMLLTLPLSAWQTRRLFSGALEDPAQANSVVFWASTHVALVAGAAMLGLLATGQGSR
jgi:1,4-dihydroxy-2-naphthoate polyprenyltransferase